MSGDPLAPSVGAITIPDWLPVLPLRDVVVYPFVTMSLSVSREMSILALESAQKANQMIALVCQREAEIEHPDDGDLHHVGCVGLILRKLKLPDDRVRILVQGLSRARLLSVEERDGFLRGRLVPIEAPEEPPADLESEALMKSVTASLQRLVTLGKNIPADVLLVASNLKDPGRLADLVASHLELKVEHAQEVLEVLPAATRLRRVNELLSKELELRFMQKEITNQARQEMGRSQREYFLRQQLKAIQKELGEAGDLADEIARFRKRADELGMPDAARQELERSLGRLERMPAESAETTSVRTYLEWMTELPWSIGTPDRLDLRRARRVLDRDHFGLDSVKERLLEHLAVLKLSRGRSHRPRGPILCFVGPPGVGKTSLGRSVAEALGRSFVSISLGGVRDEAEIRGHRRTYVGSMPGRIIQGLRQCESNNPVCILDEVDKVGADVRGDPAAALLEVLDPEQNRTFRDHYLGVPFDLSHILFITTANLLDPIHPAFRDRMEVIRLPGYTDEEKLRIAQLHLVPRQIQESGLTRRRLRIEDQALTTLIRQYTREPGLRGLERHIGSICRKIAKAVALGEKGQSRVDDDRLRELLGPPPFTPDELLPSDRVGVAAGLALTSAGGELLFVEATSMKGTGALILTGQLGEVMKESATAALSYIRSHASDLGVPARALTNHDIHIHLPAGATPKDGPSAGITLVVALISSLAERPVDRTVAMTGEITLRGDVLPVGGIKEKVLAAHRARVRSIILPRRNEIQLDEVPAAVRHDLEIHLVEDMSEVVPLALGRRRRSSKAKSRHS